MAGIPSFQELLSDFSEEVFVGRAEQLGLFARALTAPRPPFLILNLHGQAGVGKTTLLERFRRVADNDGAFAVVSDHDSPSVLDTLARFAEQFRDKRHAFGAFEERYRKYRALKEQVEADPEAPKGLMDFAFRSVTRIGLRSLRHVPVAGDAADVLLGKEAEDSIVDRTAALAAYVCRRFTNKDERVLLLNPEQELTRCFVTDLNKLPRGTRIVLIFDTYERTCEQIDEWLRRLLAGRFGEFGGNVLLVVAGRYALSQAWVGLKAATRTVELQPFTEAEAREYLERSGVTDETQIAQLTGLSERLPVLLALLTSAPGEITPDVSGSAVERFLHGSTPEQRDAALAASLPRFFDEDVLAAALGLEAAHTAFEWLSAAHFVRAAAQGWTYHEVVRALMLHYLRLRSPRRSAEIHAKLDEYYARRMEALHCPEGTQRSHPQWLRYGAERAYHLLSQSPQEHIPTALQEPLESILQGLTAVIGSMPADRMQALLERALAGCSDALRQVAYETREQVTETWARSVQEAGVAPGATLAPKPALRFFTSCGELDELSDRARCAAWIVCAWLCATREPRRGVPAHCSRAVALMPESADVAALCGTACSLSRDHPLAVTYYARAIELQPENGDYYYWRGRTHGEMKDGPAALADFARAIALQPEDGYNYCAHGYTLCETKNYPAALADFDKAIVLQPDNGDNYLWRGYAHVEMKDYAAALVDFTTAVQLQPQNGYSYCARGYTYAEMKDYPSALADFSEAIELQPENGYNYHWRGRTHFEMRDYSAALAAFAKAIELQPGSGDFYFWRGRAYLEMQDTAAAVIDFTEAIRVQPEDGYNYHWRGRTHFERKDYPAALADFAEAVRLLPEDGDLYFWRARALHDLQQYPAAIDDYSRAIGLQPDDGYNYCRRGRTRLAMGAAEQAAADLAQALQRACGKGELLYLIACSCAQAGRAGEACQALRQALAADSSLVKKARDESELEPLRASPEFQALFAAYPD